MADSFELLGENKEAYLAEANKTSTGIDSAVLPSPAKRYRRIDRAQMVIRPVDVERLIEDDHPARAIWEMACKLDLSQFDQSVKVVEGGKGRSNSDPRLLTALWIYGYSEGVSSARELSRMCSYEPGCQWLAGLSEVSYHTLSDFRKFDKKFLDGIFVQVLGLLSAEGLTELKRVMQDGTKIKAQASRDSFRREETLREHLRLAQEQVEAMGDPDSEELSQRVIKARQRAVRERKERLKQALEQLEEIEKSRKTDMAPRVSQSEPTARVMKQSDGGFAPSYNVQICTEASHKIIVAVETTQAGTDYDQLDNGIDGIEANMGHPPAQMVVDGGYVKNTNIERAVERGVDLIGPLTEHNPEASMKQRGVAPQFYPDQFRHEAATNTLICPAGKTLTWKRTGRWHAGVIEHHYQAKLSDCGACPFQKQCCPKNSPRLIVRKEDTEVIRAFRAKMQSEEARQIYRTRSEVAEFPNAWIKEKLGLRKFRLRGLLKAGTEAVWACLTYNIQQWIRLSWKTKLAAA